MAGRNVIRIGLDKRFLFLLRGVQVSIKEIRMGLRRVVYEVELLVPRPRSQGQDFLRCKGSPLHYRIGPTSLHRSTSHDKKVFSGILHPEPSQGFALCGHQLEALAWRSKKPTRV